MAESNTSLAIPTPVVRAGPEANTKKILNPSEKGIHHE